MIPEHNAKQALTDAIEAVHHSGEYGIDNEGVITRYIVVAERQWIRADGKSSSAVYITTPVSVGPVEALGLCDFAVTRLRASIERD